MDVNNIQPFIIAAHSILEQLGVTNIKKNKVEKINKLKSNYPVTVVLGITGDIRGNVTYNMPIDTAKKIASVMMMGAPIDELDDMAKSALAELSNMITGNSSSIFESQKKTIDISPPTLITGNNIKAWISSVETILIELDTSAGKIEINIGLEM